MKKSSPRRAREEEEVVVLSGTVPKAFPYERKLIRTKYADKTSSTRVSSPLRTFLARVINTTHLYKTKYFTRVFPELANQKQAAHSQSRHGRPAVRGGWRAGERTAGHLHKSP
jgi:hypothetical protein